MQDKFAMFRTLFSISTHKRGLLAGLALFLLLPVPAWLVLVLQKPQLHQSAYEELQVLARFKASHIAQWLKRHQDDGRTFAENELFITGAAQFIQTGDLTWQQRIQGRLEVLHTTRNYRSIKLLDPNRESRLTIGTPIPTPPPSKRLWQDTPDNKHTQHTALYRNTDGTLQLDILIPLHAATTQTLVGFIQFSVHPDEFFKTLWQDAKQIAPMRKSMLLHVSNAGVETLYTEVARSAETPPLTFAVTMNGLPSEALANAPTGLLQGYDAKDVAILGAYATVNDTSWQVLSLRDQSSVYQGLYTLVAWITLINFLVIVSMLLFWRQQQRLYTLQQQVQEVGQNRLLAHFFDLPFIGMLIKTPLSGRCLEVNQHLCDMLDLSRKQVLQTNWHTLMHPDDAALDAQNLAQMRQGTNSGYSMDMRLQHSDGTQVLARVKVNAIRRENGSLELILATLQDVTAHKQAELALKHQRDLYDTLSQTNQAIVHCRERGELFAKICRIAVLHGGFSMAWIATAQTQAQKLEPITYYAKSTTANSALMFLFANQPAHIDTQLPQQVVAQNQHSIVGMDSTNPHSPWSQALTEAKICEMGAFPIRHQGKPIGALVLYVDKAGFFSQQPAVP